MATLPAARSDVPAIPRVAFPAGIYFKWILGLALVSRLCVVLVVIVRYPKEWLFSKAPDLGYLAQSLRYGRGFSSPFGGSTGPTAFLAPGYPAMVAMIFRVFGSYSHAAAATLMIVQTLFGVLTVALIIFVAGRTFGAATANLAGAFWSISLPPLWLPAVPWETGLSALLLIGMCALALRCAAKPDAGLWAWMGAYCGLAMLVNPSLLLALFAIAAWTTYQARSGQRAGVWCFLLVFLGVFAMWPIRNARVLHAFVPLRSNFGYELWQGNHAGATGNFDPAIEPLQNKTEYATYAREGEIAYMKSKSVLARSYILEYPGTFLRLSARRVWRFWTGTGSTVNSGVVELFAGLTSVLGLLGLGVLFHRRRAIATLFLLPVVLLPLPYYITHPDFRFRLLLDPLLTILGAYAITELSARSKNRGAGITT